MEVSAKKGSSQTRDHQKFSVRQSFGRGSGGPKIKEEDDSSDLEEKPIFPPEVPSGTTAGRTAKYDLLDGTRPAKAGHVSSKNKTTYKDKRSKATAQKLSAPDSEGDDQETSGAAEIKMEC